MLNVLVVCTALAVGLLAGWFLRGTDPHIRVRTRSTDAAKTHEMLDHLRELTRNVAADVDKHQELMGQLHDELHSSNDRQPEEVINVVGKLIQSNERMQEQLNSAEQRLKSQERQIVTHAVAARTDPLTTLANRRAFDNALADAYRAFVDRNEPATVMMLDIDRFKNLNDTYGHQAGDEVLRKVASVLKDQVPEGNLIARYGGEEFAIVFPNADLDDIETIVDQTRRAIGASSVDYEGLELRVTASGGVAQLRPHENIATVLGRADEALYTSKEAGRDCGHFHDGTEFVLLGRRSTPVESSSIHAIPPADYDTGISSPEVFSSAVRRRLDECKDGGTPLCVLYLKIDGLDAVRNRYGDENRVAAHRAVTLMVKATMREMDHAARFEGDGISLLLPGCTLRGAMVAAEKLRVATSRCELPKRHEQRQFTISIGVAEAMDDETEDELLNRVRDSLTAATLHGQDCTYIHDGLDCHLIGAGRVSMTA